MYLAEKENGTKGEKIMNKKHFYTAVILVVFLAIGIQPAFATIYLTADGWKNQDGSPNTIHDWDGVTGRLNQSINETIQIDISGTASQDVILDGDGYTVNLGNTSSTLTPSGYCNVINNTISGRQQGIHMWNAGTCLIEGNTVSNNVWGILLQAPTNSLNITLKNNTINNNTTGIEISGSAHDNEIYNNNFINNDTQANVGPIGANNVFSYNYWSDYTGLDDGSGVDRIAGDGIGDTDIPHLGLDNFPLVDPIPLSPEALIQVLILDVEELNAKEGIINSLDAKLNNALDALDAANAGQRQDAVNKMEAFINAVEAQSGNQISEADASNLIASANAIIAMI
jgi:parallel beta-helix repeat protein